MGVLGLGFPSLVTPHFDREKNIFIGQKLYRMKGNWYEKKKGTKRLRKHYGGNTRFPTVGGAPMHHSIWRDQHSSPLGSKLLVSSLNIQF